MRSRGFCVINDICSGQIWNPAEQLNRPFFYTILLFLSSLKVGICNLLFKTKIIFLLEFLKWCIWKARQVSQVNIFDFVFNLVILTCLLGIFLRQFKNFEQKIDVGNWKYKVSRNRTLFKTPLLQFFIFLSEFKTHIPTSPKFESRFKIHQTSRGCIWTCLSLL